MGNNKMNGATATAFGQPGNVLPMRGVPDDPTVRPPTWMERRAIELGVIEMASAPTRPPGFYVNWSTVTGIIAIIGVIGALFVYVWNTAHEQGAREAKIRQLEERLQKAEFDAAEAKKFSVYDAVENQANDE